TMLRDRRRSHFSIPPQTGTLLMTDSNHTSILGAGVIGASWAALFLAAGRTVAVFDVSEDVEKTVRDYVERAWPTLQELGLVRGGNPDAVTFHKDPAQAVEGASFVQEGVPERIAIKHRLYSDIEARLDRNAIVATSA